MKNKNEPQMHGIHGMTKKRQDLLATDPHKCTGIKGMDLRPGYLGASHASVAKMVWAERSYA
jgi:hypothetical protein